jgi:hypothetical protein
MSVLIAAVFAVACWAGMSRAVFLFTVLAFIPYTGLVDVSGEQAQQSVRLVELLATVLIAAWAIRRGLGRPERLVRTPFNRPLALLLLVSGLSLVSGFLFVDPNVPADHVKLTVAIGQILLLIWPIGVYVVVANTIRSGIWVKRIRSAIVVLALPTLAYPLCQAAGIDPPVWSVPFALVASPLCFAIWLDHQRGWRTVWLAVMAASPIVAGMAVNKAFWYIAGSVALLTVAWVRHRPLVLVLGPLLGCVILLGSYVTTGDALPATARALVSSELADQSLGGPAGREHLVADAIRIWSKYPLLGVGPGNMWPYMHTYSVLDTSHDQFTNILMELGLAGLGCLAAFILGAIRMGLGLWRNLRIPFHRNFALGWLGLFVGMVAGGVTGDVMFPSIRNGGLETFALVYPQWVMLGLVASLARLEIRDLQAPAPVAAAS